MQGYLLADTICSEMRTVFRGESSRKLWALKDRLCPRTNIYMCEQIITLNFVSLTYFWNAGGGGECLWIAYGLLHGMYTSLCSLVWLYEQTKMSLLLSQLLNSYPSWITFETIAFILPDVRFQNWVISLGISPRIFSRFSWGGDIRSRDEFRPLACEQIYSWIRN